MKKLLSYLFISCFVFVIFSLCVSAASPMYNGIYNNAIYTIENRTSEKNLSVSTYNAETGVPNNTNVCQYTASDTDMTQKFRLEYVENEDAFYIWAVCSGGSEDKKLTIVSNSGSIQDGCNVIVSNSVAPANQLWKFFEISTDTYIISPKSNPSLVLYTDDSSNGTSSGTSWDSPGNVYLETLVDIGDQTIYHWYLTSTNWRYMFSSTTNPNYINISSPFNEYRSYNDSYHKGFDINDSTGSSLYNVLSGTVLHSDYSNSAGNYTVVELNDGFTVRYLHMQHGFTQISIGTLIRKGLVLGNVGNTGDSSGQHLHFDVNITGETNGADITVGLNAINPVYFFPQVDFTHNYA